MNYYTTTLKTISLKISEPEAEKETASSSRACYKIAQELYKQLDDDQEHFTVFFLDTQNKINGFKTMFTGGQNSAMVDLKIIFRYALNYGATAIICVHNHPSGNPWSSVDDDKLTQEIVEAGELLKIKVHDHLILGKENQYFSYSDEGKIQTYVNLNRFKLKEG